MKTRTVGLDRRLVGVLALALATRTAGAGGVERFWNSVPGGDFDVPANWVGSQVPAMDDTAVFGVAGIFTVGFSGDQLTDRVWVTRGLVKFGLGKIECIPSKRCWIVDTRNLRVNWFDGSIEYCFRTRKRPPVRKYPPAAN